MPTYRNNTDTAINYSSNGKLYSFPPKTDYPCNFWVPYQELGLKLVNPDYPPVPNSIMLSGTFKFAKGVERRFNFEHCGKYRVKVRVKSGAVRLFTGSSRTGAEIDGEYEAVFDWEKAPHIRVTGIEGENEIRIDAEAVD
ncbi:MAG: hypothetical protein IJS28_07385 [Synergistaceae bacterium]|nr:hypothetical protein [Synergistaceae bacterium]